MIKEITAAGKDILEAKENARAALGVGELDDVQFEIIDAGTKGFLGFMKRPAKVSVGFWWPSCRRSYLLPLFSALWEQELQTITTML